MHKGQAPYPMAINQILLAHLVF